MTDCFSIKNINIIINTTLKVLNDTCPICKVKLEDKCIECDIKNDDTECISIIGCCYHGIHKHCIDKWIKTRNVCPLDLQNWKVLERSNYDKKKFNN
jgi:RING-box protein 1